MTKSAVTLNDKYELISGSTFMSSIQALVRLPLDQARRERAKGRHSAGFISGYRGSPIGTYDSALWAAEKYLQRADITFQPGLNEELAATAVRGTQQLAWLGGSEFEGVFALWYGKHLGADRAMEALKLGNLEGSSPTGGVLVVAGDDHGGKSSASAQGSDHALISAMIPILYPADAGEIIEYGLFGWELSRFCGAFVGLKTVTDTLDFASPVVLPAIDLDFILPDDITPPPDGFGLQPMRSPLAQEHWAVDKRLPAAQAFVRANSLDRVIRDSKKRVLSIVTAGKAYKDVMQALADLGLDADKCAQLGIRVYKLGMIWPIEPQGLAAFARGSAELLIAEEKRPIIEDQVARILYGEPERERPALSGKFTPNGKSLLSAVGELSPNSIRRALYQRLEAHGLVDPDITARNEILKNTARASQLMGGSPLTRPAFYCSGCPHNISTKLPEGSVAISAVGCHGLAAFMPERHTMMPMPMGGDGMPWVAAGPLVDRPHMFQNMGDGTYAHSGILSIRAAVAARANMTFKILYNDAVAMTGGQPVEGAPTPLDIVRQLRAENVSPVVIVTDEPGDFIGDNTPPPDVQLYHRDELEIVQQDLRTRSGVSGLVYVQTCAAEKRRRRKRGTFPDPDRRVFINPAVCEDCGDCSVQSNCVSIQPLETEFGQKRRIDQSSCNKDFSCVKGFCPSFVSIEGGHIARSELGAHSNFDELIDALPDPVVAPCANPYGILVTGIGGTGVLTIGAVLGMAAHLDGKACTVLDQTGMAQKGGAVTSHLRVCDNQGALHTARLDVGMTDLILGCDAIVAAYADVLKTVKPNVTAAVLNTNITPTGQFQTNQNIDLDFNRFRTAIASVMGDGEIHELGATQLATVLAGDSIATNFLMVGFALQKGLLPISVGAIEQAIILNGRSVQENLRTLSLGRLAAEKVELFDLADPVAEKVASLETLDGVLASRIAHLTAYQDGAYADTYLRFVVSIDELTMDRRFSHRDAFVRSVALTLAKLMSYKDEYEVARLYTDGQFAQAMAAQFGGTYRLHYHLAPPLIARADKATGRPRKIRIGAWFTPVFKLLCRMKGLRGTPFDPFGYTAERRTERTLIEDYKALMTEIALEVTEENGEAAVALAQAAGLIRGFGPVKETSIKAYTDRLPSLMADFRTAALAKKKAGAD